MHPTIDAPIYELMSDKTATAFYTTRGKISSPLSPYDGFNVCGYTGDSSVHTTECMAALSAFTGIGPERIIMPRQTHSINVASITAKNLHEVSLEHTDAIVTDIRGLIIGVNTADCVPAIFSDSQAGIIGIAHAGWRGALNGIIENTLHTMIRQGARPENIKAAMGPSICQACFEVGTEVAEMFDDGCVDRTTWEKPHVSLHGHIAKAIISQGVPESNIQKFDNSLCTHCHTDIFFSARTLGIGSGRVFSFIIMQ